MPEHGSVDKTGERPHGVPGASEQDERNGDVCGAGGCCGMYTGRGGKIRMALLVVLAVVVVVLLVHGFATA